MVEDERQVDIEAVDLDAAASISGVTALNMSPREALQLSRTARWTVLLNLENGQLDARPENSKPHARTHLKAEQEQQSRRTGRSTQKPWS